MLCVRRFVKIKVHMVIGEQLLQNGGEAIIDNRLICTVRPGNDAMTTNQTRFHEGWKNESGSLKSNMSKEKGQFKISVR